MSVRLRIKNFQSIANAEVVIDRFTVVTGANNSGKALRHGTLVATPDGWACVEMLRVGDCVLAGDGTMTTVTGVFPQGFRPVWTVAFDDGRAVVVDEGHLWQVSFGKNRFRRDESPQRWEVVTTSDLVRQVGRLPKGTQRPAVPKAGPARYSQREVPLNPYLLGVLLGGGSMHKGSVRFSSADTEVVDAVRAAVPAGVMVKPAGGYGYRITTGSRWEPNPVLSVVRALSLNVLAYDKFVPDVYKYNAIDVRLAVLQGLMDTDGCVERNGAASFTTTSRKLADDVSAIVWSLGGEVRTRSRVTTYTYRGERKEGRRSYTLQVRLPEYDLFRLPRKLERVLPAVRRNDPLIVSLSPAGTAECTCIAVAHPSHLFQVENHIVTHNTALIRAVQGVFSNASGDAFVRHGADKLVVELTFDDGQSVRWEKGPKVKPTYVVAGKTLYPGRVVPDEVTALGIRPIQVGQVPVWPQVAQQFTGQVFLLDLPGSNIAEAVADVERVGRLTQALRLAEADKRSASADLRVRRQDVETGKRDVEAYAGVDGVASAVTAVEALLTTARQAALDLAVAEGLRVRARSAEAEIARFSQFREVRVPEMALVSAARDLGAQVAFARSLSERIQQAKSVVGASAGIRNVVVPAAPTSALAVRDELRGAVVLRDRLTRTRQAVNAAQAATQALRDTALDTLAERTAQGAKVSKTLALVRSFRERMDSSRGEVETLRTSLRSKGAQLAEAEAEVKSMLETLGVCPVCSSEVLGSHAHGAGDV